MKFSPHWSFSPQEFAFLYFATLAMWAGFSVLVGEQFRSWMEFESPASLTGSAWFILKFSTMWALLLACGLAISRRVGIKPLSITMATPDSTVTHQLATVVGRGILWGLAIAIVFDLMTRILFHEHLEEWNATARFQNWRSFSAAAIGASLGEEAIFRLFLFPLIAWLVGLMWSTPEGLPTTGAMWVSMAAMTLLFASTHLIVIEDFGGYTSANIVRGLCVFVPPAVLLGLAFWKDGIETAMIAHGSGLIAGWLILSTMAAFKTESPG